MKIVATSDIHGKFDHLDVPNCDMFICAGDFSKNHASGIDFFEKVSKINSKYKIIIPGNHETWLEELDFENVSKYCATLGIILLCDTSIEIEGIKIFGTPRTPDFGGWAYMHSESELKEYYKKIPDDVNILISHTPAKGILDRVNNNYSDDKNVGSTSLLNRMKDLKKLKYHIFGHIHEGAGIKNMNNYVAINASYLNERYMETNKPIIFDY